MRGPDCDAQALVEPLTGYLREVALAVLEELYPGALAAGGVRHEA
jgi:hypothetical protein